eukprot:TRINITY_DN3340_c0_g1_i1.p1 TRINITY_DN3340_c0_g1~~TRINITY_DN3340_c0_g1_i1.p1  ORF type:complete len:774 (-),score=312.91 TRINITY_DN3340_c0_g1_i1:27-2348(-)
MASAADRKWALRKVASRQPIPFKKETDKDGKDVPISSYFGINAYGSESLKRDLTKEQYEDLCLQIEEGKPLDSRTADVVANAVKNWAISKGATHYAHWFQPQTGSSAEKHDAFIWFSGLGVNEILSGGDLMQSEPDASSFPSGGMRSTFEARGYTAWDPRSPMYLVESSSGKTLCIPSLFMSYYGHALDERTALLRSQQTISKAAVELLHTLGKTDVKRVDVNLGVEQEYFLVDKAFFELRQDLIRCNRTLIGEYPTVGGEHYDHYFGTIEPRVLMFMSEIEHELHKLGIPVKTRHNEVAPCQFELAPIFERADLAVDHNTMTMNIMKMVAGRHSLQVLFHPKPFEGVNGSGKHCNWSISCNTGENLLDPKKWLKTDKPNESTPSKAPDSQIFLTILLSILLGVRENVGLLNASVASACNDSRLGANEAPPSIISVFLGSHLSSFLKSLFGNAMDPKEVLHRSASQVKNGHARLLHTDITHIPDISQDTTDRNRTSSFAFTGNKFEFRAVASDQSPAFPTTIINAIAADGLNKVNKLVADAYAKNAGAKPKEEVLMEVLAKVYQDSKDVLFEGNSYSKEWHLEAARRGLPTPRHAVDCFKYLLDNTYRGSLVNKKIYEEQELCSRFNVLVENYISTREVEADTAINIVRTNIVPACEEHLKNLIQTHTSLSTFRHQAKLAADLNKRIDSLMLSVESLIDLVDELESFVAAAAAFGNHGHSATGFDQVAVLRAEKLAEAVPCLANIRKVCDVLENTVADDLWPLPKFREMMKLQ